MIKRSLQSEKRDHLGYPVSISENLVLISETTFSMAGIKFVTLRELNYNNKRSLVTLYIILISVN